jgi:hypothetical protein
MIEECMSRLHRFILSSRKVSTLAPSRHESRVGGRDRVLAAREAEAGI